MVDKSFNDHEIVPDVLTNAPKRPLNVSLLKFDRLFRFSVNRSVSFNLHQVSYGSAVVGLGNELTPTQVKDKPKVTWQAEKGAYYSLVRKKCVKRKIKNVSVDLIHFR